MKADFNEIYRLYARRLYLYIYGKCRNNELAEDVMQTTFLKAIININNFREESSIYTWLTEYKNIEQVLPISRQPGDFQLTRRISTEGFMLDEDEVFFITVYRQSYYIDWDQSTLYWQIKGDKETYNSPVLITVVDRAALDSIINEIAQLDKEEKR